MRVIKELNRKGGFGRQQAKSGMFGNELSYIHIKMLSHDGRSGKPSFDRLTNRNRLKSHSDGQSKPFSMYLH